MLSNMLSNMYVVAMCNFEHYRNHEYYYKGVAHYISGMMKLFAMNMAFAMF